MDFLLSEERKMLQETVGKFFDNNYKNINKSKRVRQVGEITVQMINRVCDLTFVLS